MPQADEAKPPGKPGLPQSFLVVRSGFMEAVWVLLGMLFVRREIFRGHAESFHFLTVQEPILLALALVDGMVGQVLDRLEPAPERSVKERNRITLSVAGTVILYVACAALAQKLSVGTFGNLDELARWLGILLVAAGVLLRFWACLSLPRLLLRLGECSEDPHLDCGPYRWLRYPDRLGQLVCLIGIAFVFATWIPLLAVPGIFVLLRWQVASAEAYRSSQESQIGESYRQYKKGTKVLLPLIY